MLDLMHNCFFWPHMVAEAREHVEKCCQCVTLKVRQLRTPMENIVATHPLELVHFDYLCQIPGEGKKENVLEVMDHFTCYAQAYVMQSQTAQTTAKGL